MVDVVLLLLRSTIYDTPILWMVDMQADKNYASMPFIHFFIPANNECRG